LTGGTCEQDTTVYGTFELLIGTLNDGQHLSVFVSDMSEEPVADGDHQGGLTLVTIGVEGTLYTSQAKVTLSDGQRRGSFAGTSAGTNPVEVSGTFAC
jgi:hypothetical protein